MSQIAPLISDLAVIMVSAGIITLLFKWLKQPVVLGYIVAGIIAGPYTTLFPTVSDTESIRTWGEVGVIFLLFALGLDFSFKKLLKVGGTAIITAMTIVIGMMTMGYTTGLILGWGHMNSLFLGGMLAMSSTTIIYKAFEDMELGGHKFADIVLGILIVEDLFAVLLMVMLSTLAVSKQVEGMELIQSIINLGIFLLLCFVVGIYLIPSFLKKAKRYLNDETLLIVCIGLCLGMVFIATKSGFSSALGAFVMGSILAETLDVEHINRVVRPVKDLFGAIFFVSVGMLIDPQMLWEYKWPILLLTIVVIVGQITFATFGVLLSGQPIKIALQSGFALSQIGEFAFIIASLGLSLKVTDKFLYPIIVAVSVITTFLTPYMIRMAEPASARIEKHIPQNWLKFIERYTSGSNTIRQKSTWQKLLKSLLRVVGTYTVITLVAIFLWLKFVAPVIQHELPGLKGSIVSLAALLLLISPMLRAIAMKKNHSKEFQQLWNDNKYNRGPLVSLVILRIMLCIGMIMVPVAKLLNVTIGIMLAIASTITIVMILSKRLKKHSILMERRFFANLTAKEMEEERKTPIKEKFTNHLLERDLHLANYEVKQNSPSIGKSLKELNFRQKCNVNIVSIIRGEEHINIPGGNERIYPFDKLVVVGSDDDLKNFRQFINERYKNERARLDSTSQQDVNMEQFIVIRGSRLIGRSIVESGIRDNSGCLVIGIERGATSIQNPSPQTTFEEGDVVWIVGEHDKVLRLSEGETV